MARCPNCNKEVPSNARFCPNCGFGLPQQQPSLPFSPWESPQTASQPSGSRNAAMEPAVGPPLTTKQVGIAIGAILLFLALVIIVGRGGLHGGDSKPSVVAGEKALPIIGIVGEAVDLGDTTWGVAFTDTANRIDDQPPANGQFYAVGIVIGNKSREIIPLSRNSVGLIDEATGKRYIPRVTAWGTPDQIKAGKYSMRYSLSPGKAVAGLIVFDIPLSVTKPRLLVRDLVRSSEEFTAEIDLLREKKTTSGTFQM